MAARPASSRLLPLAVAVAVAAAIAWGLVPRPVPAEARPVRRGRLAIVIRDDGVTRIKDRHLVAAPLAGRMNRVELEAGDVVRAGETIVASIEPTDPVLLDPRAEAEAFARVETARAVRSYTEHVIDRAKVSVEYTAADLKRAQELYPTKAITHEQLDAAERAWREAVEDLDEAEQEYRVAVHLVTLAEAAFVRTSPAAGPRDHAAERRLDIRSPVNGRVLRVLREDFGPIDVGLAIVEVGDPENLEAVVDLVSEDAVRVKPHARCELTAWGGERPLTGHVRMVEPRGFTKVSPLGVEEQRVNVIIAIDAAPEARATLGDDYRIEAAITIDEVRDAVLVPLAAVFRHGGGEAVYAVDGGRARLVPVRLGRRGDREAEVLAGLAEGQRVIVYPADTIGDGAAVALEAATRR
jgi:HlyD family secretion protein